MAIPDYPRAPRADLVEDLFGHAVADPYRILEEPGQAVTDWISAENRLTEQILSTVPGREEIRERITRLWDYPKAGVPLERGGVWFQARNSGLQDQAVLYAGSSPSATDRVLMDPNGLSEDGTVSLTNLSVSEDGTLAAYSLSAGGSDWNTWHIRHVQSGADLPDRIEWSKFSPLSWTKDGSGFYYGSVDPPADGDELVAETRALRVMHHHLGRSQAEDALVYVSDAADCLPFAVVSDDGNFLIVTIQRGTGVETDLLVKDLREPNGPLVHLVEPFQAKTFVVANQGERFWLLTDAGAERGRVVSCLLSNPAQWSEVVPESHGTLTEVHHCGGRLVCHYLESAHSVLRVFDPAGGPGHEIPLPGLVSLESGVLGGGVVEGRPESDTIYFKAVSYIDPGSLWTHNLSSGSTDLVERSAGAFDPTGFVTEQVQAVSPDGTAVPMFLTRSIDAPQDGTNEILLYGYGGFDVPLTPTFSVMFATWLQGGGVLAVANLRGGGEFGRAWHEAGTREHKVNVFDDFCACASWLAESRWSDPSRIAINGGSNGGLLVGACITRRPELFGAAVADVGVFDMLRFHKWTIGWAWKSDFGDPDDAGDFRSILAYSPLHNVGEGVCYPPTLLLTGDHDDRVVPFHSYKFAATLQNAQSCENPVLLRVEASAGHGLGKPTKKLIGEATDRIAFIRYAFDEKIQPA